MNRKKDAKRRLNEEAAMLRTTLKRGNRCRSKRDGPGASTVKRVTFDETNKWHEEGQEVFSPPLVLTQIGGETKQYGMVIVTVRPDACGQFFRAAKDRGCKVRHVPGTIGVITHPTTGKPTSNVFELVGPRAETDRFATFKLRPDYVLDAHYALSGVQVQRSGQGQTSNAGMGVGAKRAIRETRMPRAERIHDRIADGMSQYGHDPRADEKPERDLELRMAEKAMRDAGLTETEIAAYLADWHKQRGVITGVVGCGRSVDGEPLVQVSESTV